MVMDQAGWHIAGLGCATEYAPRVSASLELNPVEHL
jgi:hypothetical protein